MNRTPPQTPSQKSILHHRLLSKLRTYGIDRPLLSWLGNFLTNRHQRVTLRNEVSRWLPVRNGVPQESVLGSHLFVLYKQVAQIENN